MTKADELLSKMRLLPCAECGKRSKLGHVCNKLSNEALADRLIELGRALKATFGDTDPYLDEAAKRLRQEIQLPEIDTEISEMFWEADIELIRLENGKPRWTQIAVDFACLLKRPKPEKPK